MAVISFSRRFIFIKCHKTASTSLEVALSERCAEEDIVTPLFPASAAHRPRNYAGADGEALYYNHMPATRIRELLPQAFAEYYKFCFERHPVDKCLSHFAMLLNSPHHRSPDNPQDWDAYLERGDFPVDDALYCDASGALLVDRIYKYEALPQALGDLSARIGLALPALTHREKAGFRFNVPSVEDVLASPAQRRRIFDAFATTLRFVDYGT